MVAKTAIVAKVVRYPVYTIDPNRRTVAVDGYWGTIKPVVTRIGFPTLIAAAGMASVPFQYLLRLQVRVARSCALVVCDLSFDDLGRVVWM